MEKKLYTRAQLLLSALWGALGAAALAAVVLWAVLGPGLLAVIQAWGLIQLRFVGEPDPGRMADAAVVGMVAGTGDRWSYYLDAEGYKRQTQRRENAYVGIGVTVVYTDERGLLIQAVTPGSPAEEGGLLPGEVIIAVDGNSLAGEERERGVDYIQGKEGTPVRLTLLSPDGTQREVELKRRRLQETSARWELLEDGVGYIQVLNFYTGSAGQVTGAVEALREKGARALVFDMRNNGGGYVDELTAMLDPLVPEGPIFRFRSKLGRERVVESDGAWVDLPMVTLVNAETYSAAEIFAAQLQESVGAPIVGEPTSGKGYSQQAIPLVNGGALNLSTGSYRTGGGVSLAGVGVRLDREVALSEEQAAALAAGALDHAGDPQLGAALELLG